MAINRVGVVGAGTMGSGIATNIAQHGYAVRLYDIGQPQVDGAIDKAKRFFAKGVERGRILLADKSLLNHLLYGVKLP